MIFIETKLPGAFIIEPERIEDERGFFARTWSAREFEERGLRGRMAECNISFNRRKGTLRGMHFQTQPFEQAKLVRCTQGSIYDVIIDLRRSSPAFKQWVAVELSADNRAMLYIPEGFAHGFQTLTDGAEVFYQMAEVYSAPHAAGYRYDDPAFQIEWPPADRTINTRDRSYPDFAE